MPIEVSITDCQRALKALEHEFASNTSNEILFVVTLLGGLLDVAEEAEVVEVRFSK